MRRGCSGGLTLLRPPNERIAASLAAYLQAAGITREQFTQSVRGFDQLVAWEVSRQPTPLPRPRKHESPRRWLARISGRQTYQVYALALEQLSSGERAVQSVPRSLEESVSQRDAALTFDHLTAIPFLPQPDEAANAAGGRVGAVAIAMRLVEKATDGTGELGSEATLCEEFDASRSILRQALRILQDLDMIQARVGRGGGYAFKRPTPIGVIRQLFAWLAARNCDPFALNALMWDLNAANVRLAGERLGEMAAAERELRCDRIETTLAGFRGPERFIFLQQALAQIADCPMVDTLARCIVSYQARSYGDFPLGDPLPVLQPLELAIVDALRRGDLDQAESSLRTLQDRADEFGSRKLSLPDAAE